MVNRCNQEECMCVLGDLAKHRTVSVLQSFSFGRTDNEKTSHYHAKWSVMVYASEDCLS